MDKTRPVVLSLGGSLVIPNGGIDTTFLRAFEACIRQKIATGWRFFITVGGGSTARHYIDAAKTVVGTVSDWDLDWLGIHATRINAHLVKTVFQDICHPRIIENYDKRITKLKEPLVIASGWQPGCSTDYDATYLAREYGALIVINMSNVTSVYDKDPKHHKDAKPIHRMTWGELEAMVGTTWKPGMNVPFDPVATQLAKKLSLTVYVVGNDLNNFNKVLDGEEFVGTVITS